VQDGAACVAMCIVRLRVRSCYSLRDDPA
jgi:hypothetical protein